jgi:CubicO group peptidase (beta-lactamase class C family)
VRTSLTARRLAFAAALLSCGDRQQAPSPTPRSSAPASAPASDPRTACVASIGPVVDELRPVVRALCSDLVNLDVVGASLAVARGGELFFSTGVGRTCANENRRPGGETPYRIGSITKMFTAALAVTLQEQGLLDLNEPVTKVLPELRLADPAAAPRITARHLLTHTSGLLDRLPIPETASLDSDGWLATLSNESLATAPGELFNYSNTGYYVLGAALQRAGGRPFAQLMDKQVLARLGLHRSTMDPGRALSWGAACGHTPSLHGPVPHDVQQDFDRFAHGARWAAPAGALIASAEDLVRFALATTKPATPTLAQMTAGAVPTHSRPGQLYGLGMSWQPLPGDERLFHHSGNTGDFSADVYWIPERGFALAVLAGGHRHLRPTLHLALEHLAGIDTRFPESSAPDLERYVGAYETTIGDLAVHVARKKAGLVLHAPDLGHDEQTLVHEEGDTFVLEGTAPPVSLTFVMDGGEPSRVRYVRARAFVAAPVARP